MNFAINENGHRIKPSYSGQKAKCPVCKSTVIGKCGEIYNWHWQHYYDRDCDPWKEHETEWHRKWKAQFPIEWQEVVIEDQSEKHIADIQTAIGLVIEFQNSPISAETIRVRENFYGEMIWVINAISFKENFSLSSIVNSKLNSLDRDMKIRHAQNEQIILKEIVDVENKIKANQNNIDKSLASLKFELSSLRKFKSSLFELDFVAHDVIKSWQSGVSYEGALSEVILFGISRNLRTKLGKLNDNKINSISKIYDIEKKLVDLSKQDSIDIDSKKHFSIEFEEIDTSKYKLVKALLKSSKSTLFPSYIIFRSENDFISYKYSSNHYEFFIEIDNVIESLKSELKREQESLFQIETNIKDLEIKIHNEIKNVLDKKIKEAELKIEENRNNYNLYSSKMESLNELKENIKNKNNDFLINSRHTIENENNRLRSQIMRKNKGLYKFNWKHERKSWQAATKKIYFDIGESYLFELVDENLFKKVDKNAFIIDK